jgi:hypothetical protein
MDRHRIGEKIRQLLGQADGFAGRTGSTTFTIHLKGGGWTE